MRDRSSISFKPDWYSLLVFTARSFSWLFAIRSWWLFSSASWARYFFWSSCCSR
ncbi:MAG: hypothetical protein MUF46_00825 [Desulfobacterales bacterium]|nr:hypothetical protein [Desulfobacterales bacterium]